MRIKDTNVTIVVKDSPISNIFWITKTFILERNRTNASIVQLVLQAEGTMECMKDHILVTRENLPNKEFDNSKHGNRQNL